MKKNENSDTGGALHQQIVEALAKEFGSTITIVREADGLQITGSPTTTDIKSVEVDTRSPQVTEIRISYDNQLEEFLLVHAEAGERKGVERLAIFLKKVLSIKPGTLSRKRRIRNVINYSTEQGVY